MLCISMAQFLPPGSCLLLVNLGNFRITLIYNESVYKCNSELLFIFASVQSGSLTEKRQQEEVLAKEIENATIRMAEVNEDLNKIVGELQNAKMDCHEGRREQMRAEILESLKRLYPDSVVMEWPHLNALV